MRADHALRWYPFEQVENRFDLRTFSQSVGGHHLATTTGGQGLHGLDTPCEWARQNVANGGGLEQISDCLCLLPTERAQLTSMIVRVISSGSGIGMSHDIDDRSQGAALLIHLIILDPTGIERIVQKG